MTSADWGHDIPLVYASIPETYALIKPHIHQTPVLTSTSLNEYASTPRTPEELAGTEWADPSHVPAKPKIRLYFKCENFQRIGAFKARGAFHAVERLKREEGWLDNGGREKGVVTHSSGNHAQAVALAAREAGIPAHIIMPSNANPVKVAATKALGANVIFSGPTAAEREKVTAEILARLNGEAPEAQEANYSFTPDSTAESGASQQDKKTQPKKATATGTATARLIPPYNHPLTILGQSTVAYELLQQLSPSLQPHAIITPLGGGGLLSGTALACSHPSSSNPPRPGPIHVFGAEPSFQGADDGYRAFHGSGERITTVKSSTIADGLRTPVGEIPWELIYRHKLVRDIYRVGEKEIKRAMRLVWERLKVVVEPSAVVGVAVVLFNEEFRKMVELEGGERGWDLGVVLTGGNVDLAKVGELLKEED